ncbi:hypothetical protein I308_106507 [Cryptococcus tetragattii IND107]|uniref:Amidase domain-containing protein n=1 Tax=Cryptococcus tetragattii IND107 TaxID=1296105 RepID=A0ABR3BJN6_9TREE
MQPDGTSAQTAIIRLHPTNGIISAFNFREDDHRQRVDRVTVPKRSWLLYLTYYLGLSSHFIKGSTIALARGNQITLSQVVEDHLDRYHSRDRKIHAWAYLDEDLVKAEAKRLDDIPPRERGPLHGMIVGVKDMIYTKDMPTQHGSKIYDGHFLENDAPCVAVLRSLGALILGKTHTTEFAAIHVGGETTNPFDQARTPGGSSSGSAAAVSDWQCHVALGTQTVGSTIRPGSFNGIFSMKFTFGAVSREGLKMCANSLDTLGVFARSLTDIELITSALGIHDDIPPSVTLKSIAQLKFAYVKTSQWNPKGERVSSELQNAWVSSQDSLRKAGAVVEEVELGPAFDFASTPSNLTIMTSWMTASVASLRPVIDRIAGQYDAIVTPSAPGVAPVGLKHTGDARYCGLPIGLTLVGPRFEDERLISVAKGCFKAWTSDPVFARVILETAPKGASHCVIEDDIESVKWE